MKELDYLFRLVETGWTVHDDLFKYQGDLLGSGEKPKYMYNMERKAFEECERKAEENGIPAKVFRSRLHKGHHPEKASTMPYRPTKDRK